MFSIYIIFEFCFRVANSFVMNPLMASRGKKVFKKETIHQDLKSKYKMIMKIKKFNANKKTYLWVQRKDWLDVRH